MRPLRYVPYGDLAGRPNVIVDGSGTSGTLMTLSHWPHSGTPAALKRDLSAESAFAYLDRPDLHVRAELVSNNHLDEDGVAGAYALVAPEHALAHRDLVIEVARAGDFSRTTSRTAARIAFALETLAARPDASYEQALEAFPALLDDPGGARALWQDSDDELERDLAVPCEIREDDDLDLAVVRAARDIQPLALYGRVRAFTVCVLVPGRPRVEQRYESWVQYVSRPVRPRRDLRPLAAQLTELDAVEWRAGAPGDLTPVCAPRGDSALDPEAVAAHVAEHLRAAPAAWDPYDALV
ncbi:MAG TPA: DUF6687 family protein [Acidimicrobiia bacterium]|nr:DUF6687 family protein [Acidimicrobiia bacterium]